MSIRAAASINAKKSGRAGIHIAPLQMQMTEGELIFRLNRAQKKNRWMDAAECELALASKFFGKSAQLQARLHLEKARTLFKRIENRKSPESNDPSPFKRQLHFLAS